MRCSGCRARWGVHPESGEPILAGIGRYGPWLRHGSTYAAIADDDDVLAIGVNRAVVVLADKAVRESRARGPKRVLRELGAHPDDGAPVWLKTGHFGPFVAHRRRYASLPKEVSADSLTLEQALELLGDGTGAVREGVEAPLRAGDGEPGDTLAVASAAGHGIASGRRDNR